MRNRRPTFNASQHQWIRQWHAAMQRKHERPRDLPNDLLPLGLGDRARLRRAATTVDLASDLATLTLVRGLVARAKRLPKDSGDDYERLGIVAGVLACINEDQDQVDKGSGEGAEHGERVRKTLAARLGRKVDGSPPMSDLRFRQMRGATNPEDLLRLWRRALHLVKNKADVAMLGDDLYAWLMELDGWDVSPSDSVRFHWAYDYYQQPRGKDAGGAPTPEAEAEG